MGNIFSGKTTTTTSTNQNMAMANQIASLNRALQNSNRQLANSNAMNARANAVNGNTARDQVNQSVYENSKSARVHNVGMPTGIYSRPGFNGADPLDHYAHVCDKCTNVPAPTMSYQSEVSPMDLDASAPRPYDQHDAISHHLNVCFDSSNKPTQCQLR
jgi:hypothetical protein